MTSCKPLILISCLLATGSLTADDLAQKPPPITLAWSDLAPIPNPVGLGGPIVGTHGGALIVAGGANFPAGPPWKVNGRPAGAKVWHSRIYLLPEPGGSWKEAGELPYPLAYAAVVSADDGIYILGGETFGEQPKGSKATNHPTSEVLRLEYDAANEQVNFIRNALPKLPQPCRYHAAAIASGTINVAASHPAADGSTLQAKGLWQLGLNVPPKQRAWEKQSPWPGPAREKAALVVQPDKSGTAGIYLLGGSRWAKDADGTFDFANFRYFDDTLRRTTVWNTEELARMPAKLAAAAMIVVSDRYILVFSGDTGEFLSIPSEDRKPFGKQVYCYDTHRNLWTRLADEMPAGVVTTSAVWWRDRIVIVSGETRPGIRTARVQSATVQIQPER